MAGEQIEEMTRWLTTLRDEAARGEGLAIDEDELLRIACIALERALDGAKRVSELNTGIDRLVRTVRDCDRNLADFYRATDALRFRGQAHENESLAQAIARLCDALRGAEAEVARLWGYTIHAEDCKAHLLHPLQLPHCTCGLGPAARTSAPPGG